MKEKREYIVTDKYFNNIVWGSIDPRNGNIILYPPNISEQIEIGFNKKDLLLNISVLNIPDFYNGITICYNKMIQTTDKGLRSIFREDLNTDDTDTFILVDNYTINKNIIYSDINKAWYLDRNTTHLGFLVDTSGSMYNIYNGLVESAIEEFIEEQLKIENNILFYGSTFSNKINQLYNSVNLRAINDLRERFYSIKPSGSTAFFDAVIDMINNISEKINIGDEVVLCFVTDGEDNSSQATKLDMTQLINNKKENGWKIIIMGANNFDAENAGQNYNIGLNSSLNVGLTREETNNAFRSVTHSINRVRSGQSQKVQFTDIERTISSTN